MNAECQKNAAEGTTSKPTTNLKASAGQPADQVSCQLRPYTIKKTCMWPAAWKIQAVGCLEDNATHLFKRSYEAAEQWVKENGGEVVP